MVLNSKHNLGNRPPPKKPGPVRLWSKIREKIPLTNLGILISGLSMVAYWGFGLPRVDYVVQLVAVFALVLLGLALLVVIPGAVAWHYRLRDLPASAPIIFEAKRGYATLLQVPTVRWIPFIEISWNWVAPKGFTVSIEAQVQDYVEVVEALQRGKYPQIHRRFVIEDAFGLARIVLHRTESRELTVLPWTGKLENTPMLRAHSGGDELSHPAGEKVGDRIDIRRYQSGDPLKWVLWKIFARTGEMMVRTPERAISPSVRILAYLPCTEDDEPAAAAARVAVRSQLVSSDWRFRADGALHTALDSETALQQIVRSRASLNTPDAQANGLEGFLDSDAKMVRSRLVLFAPANPGPWLDNCLEAILGRDLPATVVVCTDGVENLTREDEPRYERWLRRQEELSVIGHFTTSQKALSEVVDRFTAAGVEVIGIERPTGRVLPMTTQNTLRSVPSVA